MWWWLGNTLNQLVIPAQELGGTWGKKSTSLDNGRDSPGLNRKKMKDLVAFSYSSVF